MIVDTSAILAIILNEPERAIFSALINTAPALKMSAGTRVELASVSTRRFGGELDRSVQALLDDFQILVVPMTTAEAEIGVLAYQRFGRGTRHPAHLNFGDCFAYALSKATGEPLLFKGDDFVHTDVARAVA